MTSWSIAVIIDFPGVDKLDAIVASASKKFRNT